MSLHTQPGPTILSVAAPVGPHAVGEAEAILAALEARLVRQGQNGLAPDAEGAGVPRMTASPNLMAGKISRVLGQFAASDHGHIRLGIPGFALARSLRERKAGHLRRTLRRAQLETHPVERLRPLRRPCASRAPRPASPGTVGARRASHAAGACARNCRKAQPR